VDLEGSNERGKAFRAAAGNSLDGRGRWLRGFSSCLPAATDLVRSTGTSSPSTRASRTVSRLPHTAWSFWRRRCRSRSAAPGLSPVITTTCGGWRPATCGWRGAGTEAASPGRPSCSGGSGGSFRSRRSWTAAGMTGCPGRWRPRRRARRSTGCAPGLRPPGCGTSPGRRPGCCGRCIPGRCPQTWPGCWRVRRQIPIRCAAPGPSWCCCRPHRPSG
jgi:hypothetical protein